MSLTDDQITDIACKHCKFVPEGMYLYKQFEFKSSLVAFVRECIDAATLMANGPAEKCKTQEQCSDATQCEIEGRCLKSSDRASASVATAEPVEMTITAGTANATICGTALAASTAKPRNQGRHIRDLQSRISAQNDEIKALRQMLSADAFADPAASVAGLAGAAGVDQDAARWRWLMDNCGFEPRGRVVELRLVFEPTHVQYFYELVPAIDLALAKAASTRAGE